MLVIFRGQSSKPEIGIKEGHLRQRAKCRVCSRGLGEKYLQQLEMRVRRKEISSLRQILEVVSPGDAVVIHEFEDRASDRLIPAGWRNDFVRAQVSKRSCGHQ